MSAIPVFVPWWLLSCRLVGVWSTRRPCLCVNVGASLRPRSSPVGGEEGGRAGAWGKQKGVSDEQCSAPYDTDSDKGEVRVRWQGNAWGQLIVARARRVRRRESDEHESHLTAPWRTAPRRDVPKCSVLSGQRPKWTAQRERKDEPHSQHATDVSFLCAFGVGIRVLPSCLLRSPPSPPSLPPIPPPTRFSWPPPPCPG